MRSMSVLVPTQQANFFKRPMKKIKILIRYSPHRPRLYVFSTRMRSLNQIWPTLLIDVGGRLVSPVRQDDRRPETRRWRSASHIFVRHRRPTITHHVAYMK
ncbi:unnamed protein product, partial [Nesidiocoris tenuis]